MKKPALDVFLDYVRDKGLRMTPQRKLILEVFLDAGGHLASEELYEAVKRQDPSVGQATVYRTLRLFSEAGLAHEINLGDGLTRYEPAHGEHHHDHLVCDKCGKTLEIVDDRIEALQEALAEREGFVLTGHKMLLFGVCRDCRASGR